MEFWPVGQGVTKGESTSCLTPILTPRDLYTLYKHECVPESYAVASCIRSVGAGLGYQEPWWRSAACCGAVRVIVFVEDPVVIEKVLTHLNETATLAGAYLLLKRRAPLQPGLFG